MKTLTYLTKHSQLWRYMKFSVILCIYRLLQMMY